MQEIFIVCPQQRAYLIGEALQRQFEREQEPATVVQYGTTDKQEQGFVVLEFAEVVPVPFLASLKVRPDIVDHTVYTVACSEDVNGQNEAVVSR
jgi:hypothetical protein